MPALTRILVPPKPDQFAVWHIGGTLVAGDNATNHHVVRRAGSALVATADVKGDKPTVKAVIDITHIESGLSIFGTAKLEVQIGAEFGEQTVFKVPTPHFSEKDRLDLNVVTPGGATRVQITLQYR